MGGGLGPWEGAAVEAAVGSLEGFLEGVWAVRLVGPAAAPPPNTPAAAFGRRPLVAFPSPWAPPGAARPLGAVRPDIEQGDGERPATAFRRRSSAGSPVPLAPPDGARASAACPAGTARGDDELLAAAVEQRPSGAAPARSRAILGTEITRPGAGEGVEGGLRAFDGPPSTALERCRRLLRPEDPPLATGSGCPEGGA